MPVNLPDNRSILTIDLDGWIEDARRVPSPNFNQRPHQCDVDMLVVHNISLPPGKFGGRFIEQFFTNQLDPAAHPYFREIEGMEVSAHCLIKRTGEIVQFVSFHDRAWHAGKSCWEKRNNCNDFSIGIELEGTDDSPFEPIQYQQLAALVRSLQALYPKLTKSRILGHSDIAPGRKTDPGPAFEWSTLRALITRAEQP